MMRAKESLTSGLLMEINLLPLWSTPMRPYLKNEVSILKCFLGFDPSRPDLFCHSSFVQFS